MNNQTINPCAKILTSCVAFLILATIGPAGAQNKPVSIGGAEYQLRSAVLAPANGSPVLRLTLSVLNSNANPIGIFIHSENTAVSTDSGLSFRQGASTVIKTAGIGICLLRREVCVREIDRYVVSVPTGIVANVTVEFNGLRGADKRALMQAESADVAIVLYVQRATGGGFVPLTFADVPLRNMYR